MCKIKRTSSQVMGKFPLYKVSPTLPFQNVSVDLEVQLSLLEFKTSMDQIVCSINNRPLAICKDMLQPITPNQLIKGRKFSPILPFKI